MQFPSTDFKQPPAQLLLQASGRIANRRLRPVQLSAAGAMPPNCTSACRISQASSLVSMNRECIEYNNLSL